MVSVGRILRDYREAGSVNGLLALWGFVDDTTFLTKAGHVGVVYRVRGVDYEGLSHPQRQALAHRFEAALRLLDEHCRVYQYLLKRTVAPFVSTACEQPIANEAIQRRAAYLNGRREDLYDLSLYLVLLYEAPHVARRSTELRRLWQSLRKKKYRAPEMLHTLILGLLASPLLRRITEKKKIYIYPNPMK